MSGASQDAPPVVDLRASRRRGGSVGLRIVRGTAWVLLSFGVLALLYLVYSLYFTSFQTDDAQNQLRETWQQQVGRAEAEPAAPAPTPSAVVPSPTPRVTEEPVVGEPTPQPPGGDAVALLWFERPGGQPPVTDEEFVVVDGTSQADLVAGPGHYRETDEPGADGNFAIAGHRTTYGAPFFHLDQLREGDLIHVMDPEGNTFVYRFVKQEIVPPTRVSVLEDDPLGTGEPTITLTTCHPRFSNRQRLIAFGELVT